MQGGLTETAPLRIQKYKVTQYHLDLLAIANLDLAKQWRSPLPYMPHSLPEFIAKCSKSNSVLSVTMTTVPTRVTYKSKWTFWVVLWTVPITEHWNVTLYCS